MAGANALAQGHGGSLPPNHINPHGLSQGAQAWWFGPQNTANRTFFEIAQKTPPPKGKNVDAANPNEDLAPGQSETAIAAAGNLVMSAWNDASGFFLLPTTNSLTGVGFSRDGGAIFQDLGGLPNDNFNQQWGGDPSVVAIDGGKFFIVSSLYEPIGYNCYPSGSSQSAVAVSVAAVTGKGVFFSNPIVVASGGDACTFGQTSFLDKDFMTYDPKTRTLAITYTRFNFFGYGTGQIEVVTGQVPPYPAYLSADNFSPPIVLWNEEYNTENEGAYAALAYNPATGADDIYVAWERNWFTNQFDGDPRVYIYAEEVYSGTNPPLVSNPVVATMGQKNATPGGGVKSLDVVPIPGYNRGTSNDFPRVAWNPNSKRLAIAWNDASQHPLGDIFVREYGSGFFNPSAIVKMNTDTGGALHMFPAVCFLSDGSLVTSWYDRRAAGPNSALTDYFADVRPFLNSPANNYKVTTVATDWQNVASIITPNFGDYTDNACTGTTPYFTWSDGRIGIPQPFVAP